MWLQCNAVCGNAEKCYISTVRLWRGLSVRLYYSWEMTVTLWNGEHESCERKFSAIMRLVQYVCDQCERSVCSREEKWGNEEKWEEKRNVHKAQWEAYWNGWRKEKYNEMKRRKSEKWKWNEKAISVDSVAAEPVYSVQWGQRRVSVDCDYWWNLSIPLSLWSVSVEAKWEMRGWLW